MLGADFTINDERGISRLLQVLQLLLKLGDLAVELSLRLLFLRAELLDEIILLGNVASQVGANLLKLLLLSIELALHIVVELASQLLVAPLLLFGSLEPGPLGHDLVLEARKQLDQAACKDRILLVRLAKHLHQAELLQAAPLRFLIWLVGASHDCCVVLSRVDSLAC